MSKWEMVMLGDVVDAVSSNIAQKDLEDNEGSFPIYGAKGFIKNVDFFKFESEYVAIIKDGAGIGRATLLPGKSSVIGTMQAIVPKSLIDVNYLYYIVARMNLSRYHSGSTIPHIYFRDYRNEKLPLPPLKIQQKIAKVLDRASDLIEKRKRQVERLDLLIKSQFIEMFGDLSTNLKMWEEKQLGDIANVKSSKRVFTKELTDYGVPFYRGTEVGAMAEGVSIEPTLFISEEHYKNLREATGVPKRGDYLLPSICPDGRIWMVDTDKPFYFKDGRVLWISLNKKTHDPIFLLHAIKEKVIRDYQNMASGSTFSELKIFSLKTLSVPLPPLELQVKFAKISHVIEEQRVLLQQSLAKLELNYKSLMQKCFRGEIF